MKSCKILFPMMLSLLLAGCGNDELVSPVVDYRKPGEPVLSGTAASRQASGVAQIQGLGSQCTGFIIDHGVSKAPAYLMTNGHCVNLFDSTEVLHQVPVEGEARFSLFKDKLAGAVSVNISEISWASMRGTDMAILKTDQTLAELKQQGFSAYKLAPLPKPGTALSIFGVPVQDIPQDEWALRQVLYKHVPRELIERPKAGFAIPVGQWLRGPLREWAEAQLDETRLRDEGHFDPAPRLHVDEGEQHAILVIEQELDEIGRGAERNRHRQLAKSDLGGDDICGALCLDMGG